MNSGDSPPTATRVSGTVNENAATPSSPQASPDSGVPTITVALLCSLMDDGSSSRIVDDLRAWIGTAAPGARLPSTRELVARYRVSPVTVQRALRRLSGAGLVESRPGAGTFVRVARAVRPADYGWQTSALRSPQFPVVPVSTPLRGAPDDVIALHSGYPDRELLPERLVRAAVTRAARADAAVARSPVAGLPELQSWFARELGAVTPAGVTPPRASDVIVLPGSQSGLSSVFRALAGTGQPLLMESPTYWGRSSPRGRPASGSYRCRAARPGRTRTISPGLSRRPPPGCSTRSPTTPIPPARSGR
ncbi:hypothetical protein GCM10020358_37450 [Amorphoplanes nipponensis]